MGVRIPHGQAWITQWAKGAAAQGPQSSEGPPKPRQKKSAPFLSVHAELTWDSFERMRKVIFYVGKNQKSPSRINGSGQAECVVADVHRVRVDAFCGL